MMCQESPVYLFIANKKAIPFDSPFWDIAVESALDFHHRIGLRYEIEWPPLETHYQVLWRMTPDSYCQITPVNVPLIYTHDDPPVYGNDVPRVYRYHGSLQL
jgi:hypothetical protein